MSENKKPMGIERLRALICAGVFILFFAALSIVNLFYQPPEISKSERRYLATFPELFQAEAGGASGGLNPNFTGEFETWAMDSFVFREGFRTIKAATVYRIFWQKDNNGVYLIDGMAGKIERINEDSFRKGADKIQILMDMLPESATVRYSLVPDKGYYLNQKLGQTLLTIDYEKAAKLLEEKLGAEKYLDLLPLLTAEDYYKTDLHWAQEKLPSLIAVIGEELGFADRLETDYSPHSLTPFYGVYYGQAAMPLPAEKLIYLSSPAIDGATVKLLDTKTGQMVESQMYYPDKFYGIDPYDLFLAGPQPLITIENPNAKTDKELFLFRDSFGSSLAPLFTSAYAKVTLIDLRYMDSRMIPSLVDFGENPDVLFMYSAQILNNSETLLVKAQ